MHDCSKDVRAHHDNEVTLSGDDQKKMRDRRDANRNRLRKGLEKAGKPQPYEFWKQGSYAMKTMVWHPDLDYDIDDGVYFEKGVLVGERGAEMTSLQARQMVRDALNDGSFKRAPEVRRNCVRVFYALGYHVDVPVYRRTRKSSIFGDAFMYELASASGWKRSDARDVTEWFERERKNSADAAQMRRIIRHLKAFARSRESWSGLMLSGFAITKLVTEEFRADTLRYDRALRDTMRAVCDRLGWNTSIAHPVTPNETITRETETNGYVDPRATFFHDRLADALANLEPLDAYGCTREKALKCWDKVFATTFFSERLADEKRLETLSAPAVLTSSAVISGTSNAAAAVRDAGGGRHA